MSQSEVAERNPEHKVQEVSFAEKWAPAFRMTILLCISLIATLVRVFSVFIPSIILTPLGHSL